MRFFDREVSTGQGSIFYKEPRPFTKYTAKQQLRYCVGAALYMPAIREQIASDIINLKYPLLTTIVIDLEDALGDIQVEEGIKQLEKTIEILDQAIQSNVVQEEQLPLIFVRVRGPEQLQEIIQCLGERQHILTGYVLPKFTEDNGRTYLELIEQQNRLGFKLYAMPILESAEVFYKENRMDNLLAIRALLTEYIDYVLNVRIGSTDLSGLVGVRRTIHHTIYDLQAVRDCITDILNVFLRESPQFTVSGSVWEYFGECADGISTATQGLLREVELDRLNGLIGKTIIHPTHIDAVNSMYVVSHEEYMDALKIISHADGYNGVLKSDYGNKMNEMKPHYNWAEQMLIRAEVYGVFNPQYNHIHLLQKKVVQ